MTKHAAVSCRTRLILLVPAMKKKKCGTLPVFPISGRLFVNFLPIDDRPLFFFFPPNPKSPDQPLTISIYSQPPNKHLKPPTSSSLSLAKKSFVARRKLRSPLARTLLRREGRESPALQQPPSGDERERRQGETVIAGLSSLARTRSISNGARSGGIGTVAARGGRESAIAVLPGSKPERVGGSAPASERVPRLFPFSSLFIHPAHKRRAEVGLGRSRARAQVSAAVELYALAAAQSHVTARGDVAVYNFLLCFSVAERYR